MRKAALFRSINRVLGSDERVIEAAYMWTRHPRIVIYAAVVFAGMVVFAAAVGFDDWPTRIVLGFAAVAVAVTATTSYRVVALTTNGLYLFRASRIRQVATELMRKLPDRVDVRPVGGTMLAADWQVGDDTFTVTRSYEQAMQNMAATRHG